MATVEVNRLARVVVTFTRGLAVMERAGYDRKQLNEAAATFVDALVGKPRSLPAKRRKR
jgi:hypothetical protein